MKDVLPEKETDIQDSICDYLEKRGRCFMRLNNVPAFNRNGDGSIVMRRLPKHTPRGIADILVIAGGLAYWLEVKTKKGRQSPEQKDFEVWVTKHGARYFVVRSIDEVRDTAGL